MVGAGVAGLSCALHLARAGVDVVVLERDVVAAGASGRNGGFLLAGMPDFYPEARERHGAERARAIYAATLEAQERIYELAGELGLSHAVRRCGALRVAASEEEARAVRRQVEALREDGLPGELLERDELPQALRGWAHNACLTPHDGALHPGHWIRGLARAAERAGARLYERSPVSAPVPAPAEGPLRTPEGELTAAQVVVAADGALPALVPGLAARVRPRRLHMVATAAHPRRVLDRPVYSRQGLDYVQQEPGGRLLAGGFSDLDAAASYTDREEGDPRVWERIERWLREDLGVPEPATHRWVGVVGYSEERLPCVGELDGRPGLHVAGGYSGHGNVPGFMAGAELARAIAAQPGAATSSPRA